VGDTVNLIREKGLSCGYWVRWGGALGGLQPSKRASLVMVVHIGRMRGYREAAHDIVGVDT